MSDGGVPLFAISRPHSSLTDGLPARVRYGLIVDRFEETIESDAIVVLAVVHVVLDRADPADNPAIRVRQKVLSFGVLEERVLRRGQQRMYVAAQLWDPQRIIAIVVVREGDEAIETAPV